MSVKDIFSCVYEPSLEPWAILVTPFFFCPRSFSLGALCSHSGRVGLPEDIGAPKPSSRALARTYNESDLVPANCASIYLEFVAFPSKAAYLQ